MIGDASIVIPGIWPPGTPALPGAPSAPSSPAAPGLSPAAGDAALLASAQTAYLNMTPASQSALVSFAEANGQGAADYSRARLIVGGIAAALGVAAGAFVAGMRRKKR